MKPQNFKIGEDFTICDMCKNYSRSECGTSELCNAKNTGSKMIARMDLVYISERMNGSKTTCKEFKREFSAKEIKEQLI